MKSSVSILLATALLVFATTSCLLTPTQRIAHQKKAKNIILLIGDGMGLAQTSTLFYFQEAPNSFTRFEYIGLHQNTPAGAKITDSAAGATAFSAGIKTYNGAIGVDEDTLPRPTILEMAAERGLATGLLSTSSITHATPASFFAHVQYRKMEEDIAEAMLAAPVDFFAGGGTDFFVRREDGRNIVEELRTLGYIMDTTALSRPSELVVNKKYGYLLAPDGMPKMQEGRSDFLPEATKLALARLSQDKDGFFLMVEGSQIDWGGHANDSDYIIEEVRDFDKAIHIALDFAEQDGNTLVIVTADHETGGYSLSAQEVRKRGDYRAIAPTFSTGGHSASLIPVYAYGPGASSFQGVYQNNDIFGKMKNLLLP